MESFTAEVRCEKRLLASAHQAEIGMSGSLQPLFSFKTFSFKINVCPTRGRCFVRMTSW